MCIRDRASVVNGIIVGGELYYALQLPFVLSAVQVAAGEFGVVSIVGVALFKFLTDHETLANRLKLA